MNRFERQIILKNFGLDAQKRLQEAKILVVGVGGLGCPALLYLAAAGIGKIGIVDGDWVSLSNLNRQVLFGENDLKKSKVEVTKKYFEEKYTDIEIEAFNFFINPQNIVPIIQKYDLVIDATDNFSSRYLLNDACVLVQKPLITGAIYQNQGQLALLNFPIKDGFSCNYRDIFPYPPLPHEVPNCNQTGVIGVLPAIIGTMQASEAIKFVSQLTNNQANKFYFYSLLDNQLTEMEITPNPISVTLIPQNIEQLVQKEYTLTCSQKTISWQQAFAIYTENQQETCWVDVRQTHELPKLEKYAVTNIPLDQIERHLHRIENAKQILIFCQAGQRSLKAADILAQKFPEKAIFSIEKGILGLIF